MPYIIFNLLDNLVGEEHDSPCLPTRDNTVLKGKYGGMTLLDDAFAFLEYTDAFVFPDEEKAKYFRDNFKWSMQDYKEGMLKGDYIWHIINVRPEHVKRMEGHPLYADQLCMRS